MVERREALGPAERIVQTLITHVDHMVHNRTGIVTADPTSVAGVKWEHAVHKAVDDKRVVYRVIKAGKTNRKVEVGQLWKDDTVRNGRTKVAEFRKSGIFPEVAAYLYRQVAEVWKLDNEFAARWASWAFTQDNRDLKVLLAAFMLVQSRKGEAEKENDKVLFFDEDYRDVGEAMMLLSPKAHRFQAKMLLRVRKLLVLPEIAAINRELGFGVSPRQPFLGRWPRAVKKWLRYREENPKMLDGLVSGGMKETVRKLAKHVGYKPQSPMFFTVLGWKQAQAKDGHRSIAIGQEWDTAVTWEGLSETEICEVIVKDKPNYKRIMGLLPKDVGLTRAIVAAAIEAGSYSDKELIIATPTLEELGLLKVQQIRERWEKATKTQKDMRAANIARNVKNQATRDKLQEAADTAVQTVVEEVAKNIRVYFIVDCSSSMHGAIDTAKLHLEKFVQAFPLDQIHTAVFTTVGRPVPIRATSEDGRFASAASVRAAFRGISASGATDYGSGVRALQGHRPKDDEDALMVFVGDGLNHNVNNRPFDDAVQASGINPMAFAFVPVGNRLGIAVQSTATRLGIPCFEVDNRTFEDVYAIPRTIRNIVAATPVGQVARAAKVPRVTLVDRILKTELLQKPLWAA